MLVLFAFVACAPFTSRVDLVDRSDEALAQICAPVAVPGGDTCQHTFGGEYADGACSAGYQCCDGAWGSRGVCGSCVCTEVTGEQGCQPVEPQNTCDHSLGGTYADGACSAGYQCCAGSWGLRESCGTCACVEPTGELGCGAVQLPEECAPPFESVTTTLPQSLRDQMWGVTWSPGCPVSMDELVLVTATHWDLDGQSATGRVVVASGVAPVVVRALEVAWDSGFPIERMVPVSVYGGSDDASMAANNTSAFNCRAITGGSSWSQHSYGNAIDINPLANPYVNGSTVLPPGGIDYLDRNPSDPGVLVGNSAMTRAFTDAGWTWGGNWTSKKDYQHFSENGR